MLRYGGRGDACEVEFGCLGGVAGWGGDDTRGFGRPVDGYCEEFLGAGGRVFGDGDAALAEEVEGGVWGEIDAACSASRRVIHGLLGRNRTAGYGVYSPPL